MNGAKEEFVEITVLSLFHRSIISRMMILVNIRDFNFTNLLASYCIATQRLHNYLQLYSHETLIFCEIRENIVL